MNKKILCTTITLSIILLVGCGNNNKSNNSSDNKNNVQSEQPMALSEIKKELSYSVDSGDESVKIESIEINDNIFTTIVKFQKSENPTLTCNNAIDAVGNITDYLLNLEKWDTYVIVFDGYGNIELHDKDKKQNDKEYGGGYYFDLSSYEERIISLFGEENISAEEAITIVQSMLSESLEGIADVKYDAEFKSFDIYFKGELANTILNIGINKSNAEAQETWNYLVNAVSDLSKSISDNVATGLALSIVNPNNGDDVLVSVIDGEVAYNFMYD